MRVFVSSTYKDLIDHRRAVADALERLGLQLDRMETFGARPQDATRACLTEIEASELFIGIYAHRYGYIPADSAISITEAEFDHAFNNRRPTFCFFVDEAYPWPGDLVEHEPGLSLLGKFKERVGKLVVRDVFTTPDVLASRVASAIGRYLIADPRRHGARNAAQFALLTLADVAAMAFVDVMRLACVAGSDLARASNQSRYSEFIDVADLHLSDFRTQVTRLSADSDLAIITKCADVERGLAFAIVRLRRGPSLDRSWPEFIGILHQLAERVNTLAELVSHDYYSGRVGEVTSIAQAAAQDISTATLANSPDAFVQRRFSAQSAVIEQMQKAGGFAIAPIRDDIDRRLAISYFALDLALLRKATGK
ncbi:MAG: DUF4062 domain-containing protein [Pyrinomonadaceae bacterium]